MLVADCSSSLEPCFSKLQSVLKNAYTSLCEVCDVGVGVYAENFQKISSPSPYRKETHDTIESLKPAFKSDLCKALCYAADCLDASSECEKHVFVFTDGAYDGDDPYSAAKELEGAGITLHAIGFSGKNGCLEKELKALTGGRFAHSFDSAAYLDAVFEGRRQRPVCTCKTDDICIEAEAPSSGAFCKVNVKIDGLCPCSGYAFCVKLMLGDELISEKYVRTPKGNPAPTFVTFIIPEQLLSRARCAKELRAYVISNPIYL